MNATSTTTERVERVAVPRDLLAAAITVLADTPGGVYYADRLRPHLDTTVTAPSDLGPNERAAELISLARAVNDDDEHLTPTALAELVARLAPAATEKDWDWLRTEVLVHDRLQTGELDWRQEYPELAHSLDPVGIAIQQADEVMHSTAWVMTHPGQRPCVDCQRMREWPAVAADGSGRCDFHGERHRLHGDRVGLHLAGSAS